MFSFWCRTSVWRFTAGKVNWNSLWSSPSDLKSQRNIISLNFKIQRWPVLTSCLWLNVYNLLCTKHNIINIHETHEMFMAWRCFSGCAYASLNSRFFNMCVSWRPAVHESTSSPFYVMCSHTWLVPFKVPLRLNHLVTPRMSTSEREALLFYLYPHTPNRTVSVDHIHNRHDNYMWRVALFFFQMIKMLLWVAAVVFKVTYTALCEVHKNAEHLLRNSLGQSFHTI